MSKITAPNPILFITSFNLAIAKRTPYSGCSFLNSIRVYNTIHVIGEYLESAHAKAVKGLDFEIAVILRDKIKVIEGENRKSFITTS